MTITATAARLAPPVTPITSGVASGLRAIVCRSAPERPNAAPTSRPTRARGRRSSPTMNQSALDPLPSSVLRTVEKAIGKSPTVIDQQNRNAVSTRRPTITTVSRTSIRPWDDGRNAGAGLTPDVLSVARWTSRSLTCR